MKLVRAILKPYKATEIKEALIKIGLHGMTLSEVKGFGRQKGHKEIYRGSEYQVDFISKILVEVVVEDERLDEVMNVISANAKTGEIGDGKIFVLDVERVRRIRTDEEGIDAL